MGLEHSCLLRIRQRGHQEVIPQRARPRSLPPASPMGHRAQAISYPSEGQSCQRDCPFLHPGGADGRKNAARCIVLCSVLHRPSQRTASAIAAHCVSRSKKQTPWLESRGRHTRRRWGSAATDPCCLVMAPEEDQRIPFPAHSQGSVQVSHGQALVPLLFFFLSYWPLPSLSYSSGLRRLPRFSVSDSRIGIPSDGIRHFPP